MSKTVLFIITAIFAGIVIVLASVFSGEMFYTMNTHPDDPLDIEVLRHAINCAFLTYILILVPLKIVTYKTMGRGRVLFVFFGIPVGIYFIWPYLGSLVSGIMLTTVAALAVYQTLVISSRKGIR